MKGSLDSHMQFCGEKTLDRCTTVHFNTILIGFYSPPNDYSSESAYLINLQAIISSELTSAGTTAHLAISDCICL